MYGESPWQVAERTAALPKRMIDSSPDSDSVDAVASSGAAVSRACTIVAISSAVLVPPSPHETCWCPWALSEASARLQADRAIVITAVRKFGSASPPCGRPNCHPFSHVTAIISKTGGRIRYSQKDTVRKLQRTP